MIERIKRAASRFVHRGRETVRGRAGRAGVVGSATFARSNLSVRVIVGDERTNASWRRTERGTVIGVQRKPLVRHGDRVFAMGSCFAREIRLAFRQRGWDVLPDYFGLSFDRAVQSPGDLPERDNINHYDTFTILQEFRLAFGLTQSDERDFWQVTRGELPPRIKDWGEPAFQDPRRRRVFAKTLDGLLDLNEKLDDCIRAGILSADAYVITLGLTEVWQNEITGSFLCQAPHPRRRSKVRFVRSDFETNLNNMRQLCSLVDHHLPGKPIILTVSPVPLERTFSDQDVIVANMESKSILRAVAGQIQREFSSVTYWPSFEIAARSDVFEEDGRHVRSDAVEVIVSSWIEALCTGDPAGMAVGV